MKTGADRTGRVVRGRLVALATVCAFLLTGPGRNARAEAAEANDAPLPETTPAALADQIEAAWKRYEVGSIEVRFEEERDTNPFGKGEAFLIKFPGRVQYLSDGHRWRAEYDASRSRRMKTRELQSDRWASGFDGSDHYQWKDSENLLILGESEPSSGQFTPRELFWHESKSLVESMRKPGVSLSQRSVGGFRCYAISQSNGEWRSETVVSPRQGFLPVRMAWLHQDRMYVTYNLYDLEQAAPGIWAPRRIYSLSQSASGRGGKAPRLMSRRMARVVTFEPGKVPDPSAFRYTIPIEADVTDLRLGYSYHNDPWWPETRKFLREEFDWPKANLYPLRELGIPAVKTLENKAAPPIQAAAWIGSEAVTREALRGKVTLLVFLSRAVHNSQGVTAALRRVYETYHPAGLEVAAVLDCHDSEEEARRFARDYRIPFPIALDTRSREGTGATATSFGVRDGQGAFLIDREGNVHTIPPLTEKSGGVVATLIPLLEEAGAREIPTVELDHVRLTNAMIDAVSKAFASWLKAAPDSSRITGKVSDGQGKPLSGVVVRATPRLSLLIFAFPGGYHHIPALGSRKVGTTGPDGRFEVFGLTRGTYDLQYQVAGKAMFEETATIAPDVRSVTADAVLDQGDTITGVVVDENGRPVAGAYLNPTQRSYERGGRSVTSSLIVRGVSSDEAGRFRLEGLRFGSYTLQTRTLGFEKATFEKIPAGSADVKLILKAAR